MSDGGNPENGPEFGEGNAPPGNVGMQALTQYVKDLSFENPGAVMNLAAPPQTEFNIDPQWRRLDADHFEVELRLRVSAKAEDKPVFLLELVYGGLFVVSGNPPEDFLNQILMIDAPQLLFPFVRRIVADTVLSGGLPPLLLPLVSFAGIYRARAAEGQLRTGPLDA
ncbi:MAG TPA: protein-export chaperone SecB [Rhizomicrobium sp.]|nr:protein-export chaperone SecB [Rhizomicrobium sp.]